MTSVINLEKEWNKYIFGESYFLSYNNFKLCIGPYKNIVELYFLLVSFVRGKYKNKYSLFKLSYNTNYFYIKYIPNNQFIGIPKTNINDLIKIIKIELKSKDC